MSFTPTTNYALQKPDVNTELDTWGDDVNVNWDLVDGLLKTNADAIAAASSVAANSVDNTKLANMPSNTIKGCITAGDPVDLTTAQVNTMLGLGGGVVIADGSITNAKLANMPANTIKGVTAAGVPVDLTATQVNTILGVSGGVADNSVTNAKLADMAAATIKGSVAGGDPADLTGTQVTTLLNAFTTSLKGVVPASGGGTTNFMRADGTWAVPTVPAGSVAWGSITGTLSSQTDLNTALTTETTTAYSGAGPHTLVASDVGKMVTVSHSSGVTVNVNSSVFPANARIDVIQTGAGQVTFAGTATRASSGSKTKLTGQYSGATLWFTSTSSYILIGDIAT